MRRQLRLQSRLFKSFMVSIIIFIFFSFVISYFVKILKTGDYFKIKDIGVNHGKASDFSYLKGQNIFKVDLQRESRLILERYPDYRQARLVKVLPCRLFIYFIKRDPIALIKLYRYFYVDEDGVFFDLAKQAEVFDLPIILGLEKKILAPQSGRQYNLKELRLALEIISQIKRNQILKDYKITKVDAADTSGLSFFLFTPKIHSLEIKIGVDDMGGKIDILGNLLVQLESDLGNIRYIDLRFKEPVIKFNESKVLSK